MTAQFVVLSNPVSGKEVEFDRWYDDVHLGEICEVPGVTRADRKSAPIGGTVQYRSCAIYSIEHEKPQTIVDEIIRRWTSGELITTDAMHDDLLMQLYV